MTDTVSLQDALLIERVVDPNSAEFADLYAKLVKPVNDGRSRADRLVGAGGFRYTLPYKGEPELERYIRDMVPIQFLERGVYRNGVASLALAAADLIDLAMVTANRKRITPSCLFSTESASLEMACVSAGNRSNLLRFYNAVNVADALVQDRPETVIFDHTTINVPIDELLNLAYEAGVQIVDGVVPYHVAGIRGWDTVSGLAKWSYTHVGRYLVVGPDDDCTRLLKYDASDYKKFFDPRLWRGNSRKYGFEIRKCRNGLVSYRAVYLGGEDYVPPQTLEFKLPLCSTDEFVLVTINKSLAAGVFASKSSNAQSLSRLERDYAIEVRRDLFVSCVDYLMSRKKDTDIITEAIKYVSQHNYVDLVDGVRIVRCASLSYADALCVSMVCTLTAYSLRYRLTNESLPDVQRLMSGSKALGPSGFGALGRLAYFLSAYVSDAFYKIKTRSITKAKQYLYNTDHIPGVCYDAYMDIYYVPDAVWDTMPTYDLQLQGEDQGESDPFTNFLGDASRTYTPSMLKEVASTEDKVNHGDMAVRKYKPSFVDDPEAVLQHEYDTAFPGNSVSQIQNVAELRRVRSVNVNTEFYGKVEINKDVAAPEQLHEDTIVRTAAIPVTRTPLVDAIMASAKRNFNPPDIQMQSDPWDYAKLLVRKFIDWAFLPRFRDTIGASYKKNPITFNVQDYLAWKATRSGAYLSALEAECPEELVELSLEKYDTILKKRIKPRISLSSQVELAQPQVIISNTKHDNALFTSVFRVVFERFDASLRPEIKSAGRSSDQDISDWLTSHWSSLNSLQALEVDSSKYDKSQGMLARMIESLIYQELGLDPEVLEIFKDAYVGRVSSKVIGLLFILAYQMRSGGPDTMLSNMIYNYVTSSHSVGMENIRYMIAKGDDNVMWILPALLDMVVNKMAGLFNLETKLVVDEVIYFSSGYVVPVGDRTYFVPDPMKVLELLGEIGVDSKTKKERYVSFCDKVSSFLVDERIPAVLQAVVRHRLRCPALNVVRMIDALASMANDFKAFDRVSK